MVKHYWKVVRKDGAGGYVSAWAKDSFELSYEIGYWTQPTIGKIFVFGTRDQARNYLNDRINKDDYRIMKVIAVSPEPCRRREIPMIGQYNFPKFWNNKVINLNDMRPAPQGTFFADEVKPIAFA